MQVEILRRRKEFGGKILYISMHSRSIKLLNNRRKVTWIKKSNIFTFVSLQNYKHERSSIQRAAIKKDVPPKKLRIVGDK